MYIAGYTIVPGVTAVLNDLAVGQMTAKKNCSDVSVRLYTEGDRRCEQANAAGNNTGGAADWMYRVRGAPTDPRPGLRNLLWRNQPWLKVTTPEQDDEDSLLATSYFGMNEELFIILCAEGWITLPFI